MPETFLDIVKGDGFSVINMTDAINRLPKQPTQIGSLNLFEEQGVPTLSIEFEQKDGVIGLVPEAPRGAPGAAIGGVKGWRDRINLLHLPQTGAVMADDAQGIREFGQGVQTLKSVAGIVNEKMQIGVNNIGATWEYMRAGALQGLVLSPKDGSTLVNLFDKFKVASPASVDFLLGTDTTDIRDKIIEIKERVGKALGAMTYTAVRCLMNAKLFRKFVAHKEVKAAYANYQQNAFLRTDPLTRGFEFAEVFFEVYRGAVGGKSFIPEDQMRFYPVGVPGLYKAYYGPADYIETVNTMGRPLYAKQKVMDFEKGVEIDMQSNPLFICTRPDVLQVGVTSN